MRIIRGSHRGRRIQAPKSLPVRPTTDLAKESLFNILENYYYFDDLKVLDLFAGTGSISYEFASRGAVEVHSVDMNYRCIKFIEDTAGKLGFANMKSIRTNAFSYLKMTSQKYDIIFADPPFDLEGTEKIAELVFGNLLLEKDGLLIIEHSGDRDFSDISQFKEIRKYGRVHFSFFES